MKECRRVRMNRLLRTFIFLSFHSWFCKKKNFAQSTKHIIRLCLLRRSTVIGLWKLRKMQSVERVCPGNAGTVMPFKTHVARHIALDKIYTPTLSFYHSHWFYVAKFVLSIKMAIRCVNAYMLFLSHTSHFTVFKQCKLGQNLFVFLCFINIFATIFCISMLLIFLKPFTANLKVNMF